MQIGAFKDLRRTKIKVSDAQKLIRKLKALSLNINFQKSFNKYLPNALVHK